LPDNNGFCARIPCDVDHHNQHTSTGVSENPSVTYEFTQSPHNAIGRMTKVTLVTKSPINAL